MTISPATLEIWRRDIEELPPNEELWRRRLLRAIDEIHDLKLYSEAQKRALDRLGRAHEELHEESVCPS